MKMSEQIQKGFMKLDMPGNKKIFLAELAEAVEEMKLVQTGKMKSRSAKEFLRDL
ncbi:MAG: hypothetical protein K9H64_00215 [Bacteroidales bacterium]|nr:hypothetical protein [Bacteroidales bacterium]MCF8454318.1 hypothetical protein [Bacteroidales bacterium]